ncbi:MAG: methionyl-tRNA formyltransferase [Deltaproteobacteria bacterium]|nr:methionyl-tRNA formyltransferase [Deltaproteobacteria bacterium]
MKHRPKEGFPADPRIVFMGTPDYAVPSLEKLIGHGHIVQAVVTQPDRAKGRSKKPIPPAVKQAAQQYGLLIFQPERASDREFCEIIRKMEPDLLVVVAFGQVLKKELLTVPPWGGLNIHASLLPKYRGAAPIQWAIINDEAETGLSAMWMDEGLDTGPVLLQEMVAIGRDETAGELHDRLARLSGDVLLKTIEGLTNNRLFEKPQDDAHATYAPKIDRGLSVISWDRSARAISALIRALDPWPGAVTLAGGKEIKLFSSGIDDRQGPHPQLGGIPGRVAGYSDAGLMVETGEGCVRIRELQAPGRRRLPASDFLRGFPIDEGTILGR